MIGVDVAVAANGDSAVPVERNPAARTDATRANHAPAAGEGLSLGWAEQADQTGNRQGCAGRQSHTPKQNTI